MDGLAIDDGQVEGHILAIKEGEDLWVALLDRNSVTRGQQEEEKRVHGTL